MNRPIESIDCRLALESQSVGTDGKISGDAVDVSGYDDALVIVQGECAGDDPVAALPWMIQTCAEASEDDGDWSDVAGAASGPVEKGQFYQVGAINMVGLKQFIRFVVTAADSDADFPSIIGASFVLCGGKLGLSPSVVPSESLAALGDGEKALVFRVNT